MQLEMARSVFGGRVIWVGSRGVGKGNFRPPGAKGGAPCPSLWDISVAWHSQGVLLFE